MDKVIFVTQRVSFSKSWMLSRLSQRTFRSRNKFGMTVLGIVALIRNNFFKSNISCGGTFNLATVIPNLFRDLKIFQHQIISCLLHKQNNDVKNLHTTKNLKIYRIPLRAYVVFLLLLPSFCHAQILNQLTENQDDSPVIIEAEESVVCDETAQKCVATGLASAQKGTSTVYGDVLTVYFTDNGKKREITEMTADGHVRMETPTEKAYGEHAHYDVALDRIIMTGGNLKIVTQKEILTARDSIEYYHSENKGVARGNAIAQFPEKQQLVQADTLVAYFKPSSEKNEEKKKNIAREGAETEENNLALEKKEPKESKDNVALERVEAEGNMLASGPNGIVIGDRGVYLEKTKTVEVFNNVKITQDKNVIEGEYAKYNLETNVAEMYTQPPHTSQAKPSKRISGIIMPKSAKKTKDQEGHAPHKEGVIPGFRKASE